MSADTTTVADFGRWLAERQQTALQDMKGTTGHEFGRHLDEFNSLAAAYGAILIFEREQSTTNGRA